MRPGNYIDESVAQLAALLASDYGSCLRAWRDLLNLGLLTPEVNEFGRTTCFRVSPALAWRGRPWKADIAQQQFDAQQALEALAQEADHG